jgi:hypothetical protein
MPAAHVLAALFAVAAVDVEPANDRPTWNLGLELLVEVVLDDLAAASGTLLGQGSVERFIDLFGRRRLTMGVRAVLVALLAARLLGTLLGLAFGERRRLTLGRAFGIFEAFLEIANDLLQLLDAPIALSELFPKLLIFEEQLLVRRRVHANLDSDKPCQLSSIMAICAAISKWALNNHGR